jgi:threonine synthase
MFERRHPLFPAIIQISQNPEETMTYAGVLSRYRHLMDIPTHTADISILEGNTPLIPMPGVAKSLGGGFDLWVKFEGLNPTGSFKDRGMTVAISEAAGRGMKTVMCASTGNTAASAREAGRPAALDVFYRLTQVAVLFG